MPDLSNVSLLPIIQRCDDPSIASPSSSPFETLEGDRWNHRLRFPILTRGTCEVEKKERKKAEGRGKSLADHVRDWVERRVADGIDERDCELPFLINAAKLVECRKCSRDIFPGEEVLCAVRGCREAYHRKCANQKIWKYSLKEFKCPQHACFICKRIPSWRCIRCTIAWDTKYAPWPDKVIYFGNRQALCWRHPIDWRLDKKHPDPTSNLEEAFWRLPLPYIDEEFNIDSILKDVADDTNEPAPYVHIRRNIYLIKRKRDGAEADVGCTNCNAGSSCGSDCECRGLSVSCSKYCHCSDMCTNRPFRKEKKIKIIRTKSCGWGAMALEAMEKGDFVIEYIGEDLYEEDSSVLIGLCGYSFTSQVIDDALCEQRLWDMKRIGAQKFYMCEIGKNFIIDATFKGNNARFLNHSCDPNCKLEKWQVDGETRVGVFASRSIEVGEPLTYDYRFVQFGPMVKCSCEAPNCQGFLGSKRKTSQLLLCWGCKRKRTVAARVQTDANSLD